MSPEEEDRLQNRAAIAESEHGVLTTCPEGEGVKGARLPLRLDARLKISMADLLLELSHQDSPYRVGAGDAQSDRYGSLYPGEDPGDSESCISMTAVCTHVIALLMS